MKTKKNLILFSSIFDAGSGSKKLRLSKDIGDLGSIVFIGKGTISDSMLNFLGVTESKKEIFFAIIEEELEDLFYEKFTKEYRLDKPHHGIAFSMPIKTLCELDGIIYNSSEEGDDNNMAYEFIVVIVNKDSIQDVIDAAEEAGSTGGTVLHGRGAGKAEFIKLFDIEFKPEKDILITLSRKEKTQDIIKSISEKINIEEQGKGIIFVMDVNKTVGLYNGE